MGCDTKGFVMTTQKNPFEIFKTIRWAIFEEVKKDTGIDNITAAWEKKYSMPRCEIQDFSETMEILFIFAGEERRLCVFLDCNEDYSETQKGKKIILSLGAWGQSVRLMMVALNSLSKFGTAYICENDCSGDFHILKGKSNE